MQKITPFLWFDNQAEEAMNFYTSIFKNSRIGNVMRYGESGPGPKGQIWCVMADHSLYSRRAVARQGISINAASEAEATKLFKGLSAGGQVTMPLEKAFWGAYFGMFTDKFGIQWMVNYDYNQQK
jgi:PhnB protein